MDNPTLLPAAGIAVDREPDERGNLMMAALIAGGRRVALAFNVN